MASIARGADERQEERRGSQRRERKDGKTQRGLERGQGVGGGRRRGELEERWEREGRDGVRDALRCRRVSNGCNFSILVMLEAGNWDPSAAMRLLFARCRSIPPLPPSFLESAGAKRCDEVM